MSTSPSLYLSKSPKIVSDLIRDFSLSPIQASAIVGNLGHESAGFTHLQEIHPVAGRGGLGWAQWTGPRRLTFEAYCRDHGLDTSSDEGNYGYLFEELRTTQAHSIEQLRKTTTLDAATDTFEAVFERAGVPALASRRKYALEALQAYSAVYPVDKPTIAPPSPLEARTDAPAPPSATPIAKPTQNAPTAPVEASEAKPESTGSVVLDFIKKHV